MKVAEASLTSGWETELVRIERGELTQEKFLDGVLETVNEVTGEIFRNHPVKKPDHMAPCKQLPTCQQVQERCGLVVRASLFYMCKIRFSAF